MYWNYSQNWSVTYDGLCYCHMKIFVILHRKTYRVFNWMLIQRGPMVPPLLFVKSWLFSNGFLFWKDMGRFNERQSVLPKLSWSPIFILENLDWKVSINFRNETSGKFSRQSCVSGVWKWKTLGLLIFSWKDIMGRDFSSVGGGVLIEIWWLNFLVVSFLWHDWW